MNYSKGKSSNKFNLLNILFPPHCLICGKETNGEGICDDCKKTIEYLNYPLIEHKKNIYFYAIAKYSGVMEKAVKILKYKKRKIIAKDLSKIIIHFVEEQGIHFDYVAFIPMTRFEQTERGFNQTYLLAKEVSTAYQIPILMSLKKVKRTDKQVGLNKKEREENLKGAFRMEEAVKGDVLIVDDVYTTGSTAREITKTMVRKTKSNIYFVALSRKID